MYDNCLIVWSDLYDSCYKMDSGQLSNARIILRWKFHTPGTGSPVKGPLGSCGKGSRVTYYVSLEDFLVSLEVVIMLIHGQTQPSSNQDIMMHRREDATHRHLQ